VVAPIKIIVGQMGVSLRNRDIFMPGKLLRQLQITA